MSELPPGNLSQERSASRRKFLQASSLLVASGGVAGSLAISTKAHAYANDEIRIGLIGCGSRGTGAAIQALNTKGPVKLVALCDVFEKRLSASYRSIKGKHRDRVEVPDRNRFLGLDGFQKLLETELDLVILATPPGFRPLHFEAAVEADKHVFMEKPVAIDAPGVRRIMAANVIAKEKNLAVQVGLQRHHQSSYQEVIQQLQQGAIGRILFAQVYWTGSGLASRPRASNQTELEYQLSNWHHFNWLAGDSICERHVHNLDVINWLMQGHPIEAQGQGGRNLRNASTTGQSFDHHFVEFTYANGVKLISQCRSSDGCWSHVGEYAHGTEGYADISAGKIFNVGGELIFQASSSGDGCEQEQRNLFDSLRRGDRPNEADYGAVSTMTAIMGRMASYTGARLNWETCLHSQVSLADVDSLKNLRVPAPLQVTDQGNYPVATPGIDRKLHL